MPKNQPFTALCQAIGRPRHSGRADLHIHTTYSDGVYTPAQVVDLARRSGLAAVAITDHDTLAGVCGAVLAASEWDLEVIPGVEVTCEWQGRTFHLLGYFVAAEDGPLTAALAELSDRRVGRFWEMVERLRGRGVDLDEGAMRAQIGGAVLGRRNLAEFLVKAGRVGSIREAFARYLGDTGSVAVPRQGLPLAEAIALVRGAGGVASWAHPSYDATREELAQLRSLGLQAVEAGYPAFRKTWQEKLRAWAAELGLAVTAGSDCHGPEREIGACTITAEELQNLRMKGEPAA